MVGGLVKDNPILYAFYLRTAGVMAVTMCVWGVGKRDNPAGMQQRIFGGKQKRQAGRPACESTYTQKVDGK